MKSISNTLSNNLFIPLILIFLITFSPSAKSQRSSASPTPNAPLAKPLTSPVPAVPVASQEPKFDFLNQYKLNTAWENVTSTFGTLDCKSKTFDSFRVGSPKLTLFVACENVEPYLEGHKIVFKVGNPYSFSFGGIEGKLHYGKEYGNNQVEISHVGNLIAGSWTTMTATISPSKPEDLRALFLSISVTRTIFPSR